MDYNKYKYENKKRQKENLKKQREANLDMKEYRLSVSIDVHDFDTRVKQASKYLEKGHRIKASIRFRGREMAHTELGKDVLVRFADALTEYSSIDQKPTLDGRNMTMILIPKKDK
jgi:translation initiation factor IF-3